MADTSKGSPKKLGDSIRKFFQEDGDALQVPQIHVAINFTGTDAELFVCGYYQYAQGCETMGLTPTFADYIRKCHSVAAGKFLNAKKVSLRDALSKFPTKAEKGSKKRGGPSGEPLG